MQSVEVPSKSRQATLLGATLKYLYLLYGEDELVSQDSYVLNWAGHALPVQGSAPWCRAVERVIQIVLRSGPGLQSLQEQCGPVLNPGWNASSVLTGLFWLDALIALFLFCCGAQFVMCCVACVGMCCSGLVGVAGGQMRSKFEEALNQRAAGLNLHLSARMKQAATGKLA